MQQQYAIIYLYGLFNFSNKLNLLSKQAPQTRSRINNTVVCAPLCWLEGVEVGLFIRFTFL